MLFINDKIRLLVKNNNSSDIIPRFVNNFFFVENEDIVLVIETIGDKKYYFKISDQIKKIIEYSLNVETFNELKEILEKEMINITTEDLKHIFLEKLKVLTEIPSNISSNSKSSNSYIKFKITLINQKTVTYLSNFLSFLFRNRIVVVSSFIIFTILGTYYASKYNSILALQNFNYWILPLTMGISLILHELGHASACKAFGVSPGKIGFGIYIVTPVLFADVTNAWLLKKYDRVIVDIAGMYMEGLLMSFLLLTYIFSNNAVFYYSAMAIFFNTIININPLLRYDGYWILSDLTGIPNLRSQAQENLILIIRKYLLRKKEVPKVGRLEILTAVYACFSYVFLFWFVSYVTLFQYELIINFPKNLIYFLDDLIRINYFERSEVAFYDLILPIILFLVLKDWMTKIFNFIKTKENA